MSLFKYVYLHHLFSFSFNQPTISVSQVLFRVFILSTVACLEVRLGGPVMCSGTVLIVTDAVVTAIYVVVFSRSNNSVVVCN